MTLTGSMWRLRLSNPPTRYAFTSMPGGCVCSSMIPATIPATNPATIHVSMQTPACGFFWIGSPERWRRTGCAGTGFSRSRGVVFGPNLNSSFSVCPHEGRMILSLVVRTQGTGRSPGTRSPWLPRVKRCQLAVNWAKPVRPSLNNSRGRASFPRPISGVDSSQPSMVAHWSLCANSRPCCLISTRGERSAPRSINPNLKCWSRPMRISANWS